MLAPICCLSVVFQRVRVRNTVVKTQGLQAGESLSHIGRPVWPVPDEQADGVGLLRADGLPGQHACHLAASVDAAGRRLYVVGQSPIQFALQDQRVGLG
ncbi:hypothetical protein ALP29_200793 [Pseudomonas syringae pv. avii]|uniref:Uncharacterized protein n=1 Tax=Pseudomonas syringae pv. avii TaxID=663959 RepID=A0A3M5VLD3_PSESX|nr:hypothetical protein ALP29_200793 [Pseudomonas syringae pv. avii]